MKLVIAEKPSVAMSLAAVLGATKKKRWLSRRFRLSGELVRGTSFGTGTAGGLQRTVRQMAV